MCSHLTGYQHIDLSIKKRGFYSEENPFGWKINFIHYPVEQLDKMEQYWILEYTKKDINADIIKPLGAKEKEKKNQ